MSAAEFVHLHLHSDNSLLDGIIKIPELMEHCAKIGMKSVGLTDHGSMGGIVKAYKEAKKHGIQPIIGAELYIVSNREPELKDRSNYHILLLAQNENGYRNLLRLTSEAHRTFYYRPRIDWELLYKYNDGIICTTACLGSEINSNFVQGNEEQAYKRLRELKDVFGDRLYLEVQRHGISDQDKLIPHVLRAAKYLNAKVIATNDAHYLKREHAMAHRVAMAIGTKKTLSEFMNGDFEGFATSQEFYVKSPQEMYKLFEEIPFVIANTLEIAERCSGFVIPEFEKKEFKFPYYPIPKGETPDTLLRKICYERFPARVRGVSDVEKYQARMKYELDVIQRMGMSTYFLVLQDFCNWAVNNGIRKGAGRGSGAGSIVNYVLGVTDIDPLNSEMCGEGGLLFERFLNPDRVSLPDVDTDIADDKRHLVVEYLIDKYGADKVAHIGTYGTLGAKTIIKDIARVLEYDFDTINDFTTNLKNDVTLEEIRELVQSGAAPSSIDWNTILEYASLLVDLKRHSSIHAAGVVISDRPIVDLVPTSYDDATGHPVTMWDMDEIEEIGLVKMDILGLRTMSLIDMVVKDVGVDVSNIPLDDEATWRLFRNAETVGIFQFESEGMRKLLRDMKASRFSDIVAANAGYRPGPIDARDEQGLTMLDHFVRRKNGLEPPEYDHPLLEPILKDTYGIFLYQEQLMKASVALAGFTPGQSDELRKVVGKKLADKMPEMKKKFIDGCIQNNVDENIAETVWGKIETFGRYGFNVSHSVSYSWNAYQSAYLKAHYPAHFMAAALSSVVGGSDKEKQLFREYLAECRRLGIKVLPPDINTSAERFVVVDGAIRYPLSAIKNVGESAVSEILRVRSDRGKFLDLIQFALSVQQKAVTSKVIESLILTGAFDSISNGMTRKQMVDALPRIIECVKKVKEKLKKGKSLDEAYAPIDTLRGELQNIPHEEYNISEIISREYDLSGLHLSIDPLVYAHKFLKERCTCYSHQLANLQDRQVLVMGGILTKCEISKSGRVLYGEIEDYYGKFKFVSYRDSKDRVQPKLKQGSLIFLRGRKTDYKGEAQVRVDAVLDWPQRALQPPEQIHVMLDAETDDIEHLYYSLIKQMDGDFQLVTHLIRPSGMTSITETVFVDDVNSLAYVLAPISDKILNMWKE